MTSEGHFTKGQIIKAMKLLIKVRNYVLVINNRNVTDILEWKHVKVQYFFNLLNTNKVRNFSFISATPFRTQNNQSEFIGHFVFL